MELQQIVGLLEVTLIYSEDRYTLTIASNGRRKVFIRNDDQLLLIQSMVKARCRTAVTAATKERC